MSIHKSQARKNRQRRIRSKIKGTASRPRLAVFRSNSHIYCQLIDDANGQTLLSFDDRQVKKTSQPDLTAKCALAYEVGANIGQAAIDKKISQVVFDRGGYRYHGRVKSLAEGARSAGLNF